MAVCGCGSRHDCVASTAVRAPLVRYGISALNDQLRLVQDNVTALYGKIEPVLGNGTVPPPGNEGSAPPDLGCPLANELQNMTDFAAGINGTLFALIDRCEV
jgi:hypothetical protein